MAEWELAQTKPADQLAQLHFFAMKKREAKGEVEFRITVREYVLQQDQSMRFFAEADRQTNQNTAPYTPCGWGPTLLKALSECMLAIHRFPYEGPLPGEPISR
jgi:hypothetical protein